MPTATLSPPLAPRSENADRVGVAASILCAIHCLVTPPLLLLMPAFGRLWSHPATHWGMALGVVPLAMMTIVRGFRKHGRRWVVASGALGVTLVVIGAVLPYLGTRGAAVEETCSFCCPSVAANASGKLSFAFPASSIVTTLGGVCLVTAHIGNLCGCRCCRGAEA